MSEELHILQVRLLSLYLVNKVLYVSILKDHMVIMQFKILSIFVLWAVEKYL